MRRVILGEHDGQPGSFVPVYGKGAVLAEGSQIRLGVAAGDIQRQHGGRGGAAGSARFGGDHIGDLLHGHELQAVDAVGVDDCAVLDGGHGVRAGHRHADACAHAHGTGFFGTGGVAQGAEVRLGRGADLRCAALDLDGGRLADDGVGLGRGHVDRYGAAEADVALGVAGDGLEGGVGVLGDGAEFHAVAGADRAGLDEGVVLAAHHVHADGDARAERLPRCGGRLLARFELGVDGQGGAQLARDAVGDLKAVGAVRVPGAFHRGLHGLAVLAVGDDCLHRACLDAVPFGAGDGRLQGLAGLGVFRGGDGAVGLGALHHHDGLDAHLHIEPHLGKFYGLVGPRHRVGAVGVPVQSDLVLFVFLQVFVEIRDEARGLHAHDVVPAVGALVRQGDGHAVAPVHLGCGDRCAVGDLLIARRDLDAGGIRFGGNGGLDCDDVVRFAYLLRDAGHLEGPGAVGALLDGHSDGLTRFILIGIFDLGHLAAGLRLGGDGDRVAQLCRIHVRCDGGAGGCRDRHGAGILGVGRRHADDGAGLDAVVGIDEIVAGPAVLGEIHRAHALPLGIGIGIGIFAFLVGLAMGGREGISVAAGAVADELALTGAGDEDDVALALDVGLRLARGRGRRGAGTLFKGDGHRHFGALAGEHVAVLFVFAVLQHQFVLVGGAFLQLQLRPGDLAPGVGIGNLHRLDLLVPVGRHGKGDLVPVIVIHGGLDAAALYRRQLDGIAAALGVGLVGLGLLGGGLRRLGLRFLLGSGLARTVGLRLGYGLGLGLHAQGAFRLKPARADVDDGVVGVHHHGHAESAGHLHGAGGSGLFGYGACVGIGFKGTADHHVLHAFGHGDEEPPLPVGLDDLIDLGGTVGLVVAQVELVALEPAAHVGIDDDLHLLAGVGRGDRLPLALLVQDHGLRQQRAADVVAGPAVGLSAAVGTALAAAAVAGGAVAGSAVAGSAVAACGSAVGTVPVVVKVVEQRGEAAGLFLAVIAVGLAVAAAGGIGTVCSAAVSGRAAAAGGIGTVCGAAVPGRAAAAGGVGIVCGVAIAGRVVVAGGVVIRIPGCVRFKGEGDRAVLRGCVLRQLVGIVRAARGLFKQGGDVYVLVFRVLLVAVLDVVEQRGQIGFLVLILVLLAVVDVVEQRGQIGLLLLVIVKIVEQRGEAAGLFLVVIIIEIVEQRGEAAGLLFVVVIGAAGTAAAAATAGILIAEEVVQAQIVVIVIVGAVAAAVAAAGIVIAEQVA